MNRAQRRQSTETGDECWSRPVQDTTVALPILGAPTNVIETIDPSLKKKKDDAGAWWTLGNNLKPTS
jgi:hypothetical protein